MDKLIETIRRKLGLDRIEDKIDGAKALNERCLNLLAELPAACTTRFEDAQKEKTKSTKPKTK